MNERSTSDHVPKDSDGPVDFLEWCSRLSNHSALLPRRLMQLTVIYCKPLILATDLVVSFLGNHNQIKVTRSGTGKVVTPLNASECLTDKNLRNPIGVRIRR
jgi:hypothetical protein